MNEVDKRALKILYSRYWGASGWKDSSVGREEFDYAKSKGIMFESVVLDHDEIVEGAVKAVSACTKDSVVSAFLSSLTSRRLDLRSALGSYACGVSLPPHKIKASISKSCLICSEYDSQNPIDLNVLNFERFKFGGVRHLSPSYIWFDLNRFIKCEPTEPTKEDVDLLIRIFKALELLEDNKISSAEKCLSFLKSNKNERVGIISTLGYCGILNVAKYPAFYESYIKSSDREYSNYSKSDWPFPADLWTPDKGLRRECIDFWFGRYL